jgi:hypothetical protein
MNELIKALLIFQKYRNLDHPTVCDHDAWVIVGVPHAIDQVDAEAVNDLGFYWSVHYDAWVSTKFSSA